MCVTFVAGHKRGTRTRSNAYPNSTETQEVQYSYSDRNTRSEPFRNKVKPMIESAQKKTTVDNTFRTKYKPLFGSQSHGSTDVTTMITKDSLPMIPTPRSHRN